MDKADGRNPRGQRLLGHCRGPLRFVQAAPYVRSSMKPSMHSLALVGLSIALVATIALAQQPPAPVPGTPTPPPPPSGPPPFQVVPPPQAFKTSTEHYQYLKRLHKGGTQHTWESVPKWEGIWQPSWNSVAVRGGVSPFFVGAIPKNEPLWVPLNTPSTMT